MGEQIKCLLMFSALLENTQDSIVFKEYYASGKGGFMGGKIVSASRVKAEHYGYDMHKIIGLTDFELMPYSEALKSLIDDLWVMQNRKSIEDKRETITHKNGEKVEVSVSKFPWLLSNDEIIGVICIARHIKNE